MFHAFLLVCIVIAIKAAPLFEEGCALTGEFGNKFEGDMLLTNSQRLALYDAVDSRNGLIDGAKRWPEKVVIYVIEKEDFGEDQLQMIINGINDIANNSCVKFREKTNNNTHHVIIKGSEDGCFSNVGFTDYSEDEEKADSYQVLNLSKGCFRHGTVVHELLHTLGFYHMQSTFDRDDYVKIVWENIRSGTEHNFAKYRQEEVTDFGVPYDYGSVMHYPATAFSKTGNRTIVALKDTDDVMGQRDGMSEKDIVKLNKMYCEPHTQISFIDPTKR